MQAIENILWQLSAQNGKNYQEVYSEMQEAIRIAIESGHSEFWSKISHAGKNPTPQDVILYLTELLVKRGSLQ